jgi:uncharacterized protein
MESFEVTQGERNTGVLLHLSSFAGIVIPYAGWVAPIAIWLIYRGQSRFVDRQGYAFINAMLSYIIYSVISFALILFAVGIILLLVLVAIYIYGTVRAALAARDGEIRQYPLAIRFFQPTQP